MAVGEWECAHTDNAHSQARMYHHVTPPPSPLPNWLCLCTYALRATARWAASASKVGCCASNRPQNVGAAILHIDAATHHTCLLDIRSLQLACGSETIVGSVANSSFKSRNGVHLGSCAGKRLSTISFVSFFLLQRPLAVRENSR